MPWSCNVRCGSVPVPPVRCRAAGRGHFSAVRSRFGEVPWESTVATPMLKDIASKHAGIVFGARVLKWAVHGPFGKHKF